MKIASTPSTNPADESSIGKAIRFREPLGSSVQIANATLRISRRDGLVTGCILQADVDLAFCRRVESNDLFNLQPELKISVAEHLFNDEMPVTLTLQLHPEHLSRLAERSHSAQEVGIYLQRLSQSRPKDRLLRTESWHCQSVIQATSTGERGYRTFWDYPGILDSDASSESEAELAQSMGQFLRDYIAANIQDEITNDAEDAALNLERFSRQLKRLGLPPIDQRNIAALTENFTSLLLDGGIVADEDSDALDSSLQPISASVRAFFEEDNWSTNETEPGSVFQVMFMGDNGQWDCYAQIHEESRQIVFYSVLPFQVAQAKQMAIARFITRANFGFAIGNFELDFESGTLRFRTSLRSPGTELSPTVVKDLIYTNVLTVDQFLPNILQILNPNVHPAWSRALVTANR